MVTMKDMKRKALKHQHKYGVTQSMQKRIEKFGTFNKVHKLPKVIRYTRTAISPLKRFQKVVKKVMAQNKTNKWRKNTQKITFTLNEPKIQKIKINKQVFPIYPSTRKGREGEILTNKQKLELNERIKVMNTQNTYTNNISNVDFDLDCEENDEYDFDEWNEEHEDIDIDDVNYD